MGVEVKNGTGFEAKGSGLDVIGDVHGRAGRLIDLLLKLGYVERDGVYRHPSRFAVFSGDLVDRGPNVAQVLEIARRMQEAGAAEVVLGNHEFNLLSRLKGRCRMTDAKTTEQKDSFPLIEAQPDLVDWLLLRPVVLEKDGARFVHGYWGAATVEALAGCRTLPEMDWDDPAFNATQAGRAVKLLLCGPEVALPDGVTFHDRHGRPRDEARVAWWNTVGPDARLKDHVLPAGIPGLDGTPLRPTDREAFEPYPADAPPVFIGHYGLHGCPGPLAANVACVDYDATGSGDDNLRAIGAYRWNGERVIDPAGFVR